MMKESRKNEEDFLKDNLKKEREIKVFIDGFKLKLKKSREYFILADRIIDEFNKNLFFKEKLDEKERKFLLNKSKNLNVIKSMNKDALNVSLNESILDEKLEFLGETITLDLQNISEEEIEKINEEFTNKIKYLEKKKKEYSKKSFDFIVLQFLPMIDLIEAEIEFIEISNKHMYVKSILEVYKKLERVYLDLLTDFKIKKIEIKKNEFVDFTSMDILEIEETDDFNLDMKIESVVENGYAFFEGEDLSKLSMVLRRPCVIIYKYI